MLLQLGNVPLLVISSAEAARVVMKIHDLNTCSRPFLLGDRRLTYNYLDIAFAPYCEYWREIRKICILEVFSLKRVHAYWSIREEEVTKMINSISKYSSSGTPVNLTWKLFVLTGIIIFRIAYGKSYQGSDFDHEKFHHVVLAAETSMGSFSAAEYFP